MGRTWNEGDVAAYREWIDGWIADRAADGLAADCADLAILGVITFAARRELTVPLSFFEREGGRGKWTRVSEGTFRGDYDRFARWARRFLGAQNLADHVNTRGVPTPEMQAGDLLVYNWRQTDTEPNIPYWHTMVYVSPSRLWMGNEDHLDRPTVPVAITDENPRGGRRPADYLSHPDLFAEKGGQPSGRRWRFFPRGA